MIEVSKDGEFKKETKWDHDVVTRDKLVWSTNHKM